MEKLFQTVCLPQSLSWSDWKQQRRDSETDMVGLSDGWLDGWLDISSFKSTYRSRRKNGHSLNRHCPWDEDGVDPVQIHAVFVLQHMRSVYRNLNDKQKNITSGFYLLTKQTKRIIPFILITNFRIKRTGPSTQPCGTPELTAMLECLVLIKIYN